MVKYRIHDMGHSLTVLRSSLKQKSYDNDLERIVPESS